MGLFKTLGGIAGSVIGSVVPGVGTAIGGAVGSGLGGLVDGKRSGSSGNAAGISSDARALAEQRVRAGQRSVEARTRPIARIFSGTTTNLAQLLESGMMDRFYASPDYKFRMDEGRKIIENSANAQGGLLSGETLKALTEFGQNTASGEFGDYLSRRAGLAQLAQPAYQEYSTVPLRTAGSLADLATERGDIRAAGAIGVGKEQEGSLMSLADLFGGGANMFGGGGRQVAQVGGLPWQGDAQVNGLPWKTASVAGY